MEIDYLEKLERIANEMDQTRVQPEAAIGYDVLADALVWSDEYPHNITGRRSEFDCVKLLLRYRTTLLLGKPDDLFRPYWDLAKKRFPHWAGFCPARLAMTEELRQRYERDRKRAMRRLERFAKACCSPNSNHPSSKADSTSNQK